MEESPRQRKGQGECRGSAVSSEAFENAKGLGHIASPETESEVIAGIADLRSRQNQDAFALHQSRGEIVDVTLEQLGKRNAARPRGDPCNAIRVAVEEFSEDREIRRNNLACA